MNNKKGSLKNKKSKKALYNVKKAREPITDETIKAIKKLVPQGEFVSDGKYDEWLDELSCVKQEKHS